MVRYRIKAPTPVASIVKATLPPTASATSTGSGLRPRDPRRFDAIHLLGTECPSLLHSQQSYRGPPQGAAERTFGLILNADFRAYRDEIIISTKAGYDMWPGPYGEWGSRKYLVASLDQSLIRMGLDYVDVFYSHRPDPETPLEETMGGAQPDSAQRQSTLCRHLKLFSRTDSRILRALGSPCLLHQPRYNMFDRHIEGGLLDVLKEEGISCIVFSPLAQGLLTERYLDGIPADSRAGKAGRFLKPQNVNEEVLGRARRLAGLARQRGQTLHHRR
jgi:L-glyceraldehyde 3-phosphate reductase